MKPVITKTETVEINGQELTLIGEVYENVLKHSENYDIYSEINIEDYRRAKVHPGFPYPKQLSEDELQFELDFHKRNIQDKPKAYGL